MKSRVLRVTELATHTPNRTRCSGLVGAVGAPARSSSKTTMEPRRVTASDVVALAPCG